jgi:Glycosyl transferase family 2/Aminoglycoside adenylyltransferase, C-terminal domain/Nucleotidyltransferase domain
LDDVSSYAGALRTEIRSELGENLVGVYLYGSATSGMYLHGQSDVDMLVVVRERMSEEKIRAFLDRVRRVPCGTTIRGLDLWVIPLESTREPGAQPAFECWLLTAVDLELVRGEDDLGDPRLLLLYAMCRDHGVALVGPPPRRVFGPINRSWLAEAMLVDLALAGAAGWYRVLNACRTLHFVERGVMCGKLEGAAWARRRVADPELIDDAVEWRRNGVGPPLEVDRVDVFVDAIAALLGGAPPSEARVELPPQVVIGSDDPLVTCALPAPADEQLLLLAANRFLEQDWPLRELLVLRLPGAAPVSGLPQDERIRLVDVGAEQAGLWRVLALHYACGELIAVWDPATWYAPNRLTQQVRELLSTSVPRVVAPAVLAVDPSRFATRRLRDLEALERTTLCARRSAWTDSSVASRRGERADIAILVERGVAEQGAPVAAGEARQLMHGELDLYAVSVPPPPWPRARPPSVSCLMPTYNRRTFAARAIAFFLEQDYPNRELVIVDDGEEAIADLVPADAAVPIRHHRLAQRATIGCKRELACELADGDILVQWDDDDWYGRARVRRQIAPLVAGGADITGILRGYLLDLRALQFWKGEPPLHEGSLHALIIAGTLAFTRDAWRTAGGYPDRSIGEEVALLGAVKDAGGSVASILSDGIFVQIRHAANSWRLPFDAGQGPPGWFPVPRPQFVPLADLRFYESVYAGATAELAVM